MRLALVLSLCLVAAANASERQNSFSASGDVESLDACMRETVHLDDESHCVGLLADACTDDGDASRLNCLQREEAAWDAILGDLWPFRCGTCPGGFSLFTQVRANRVSTRAECGPEPEAFWSCILQETARQAITLYRRAR